MIDPPEELAGDVRLVGAVLDDTVRAREGDARLATLDAIRQDALALRAGELPGGRAALADRIGALDLDHLDLLARDVTVFFHLVNSAEEQHRQRVLRRRDTAEAAPEGSIASLPRELRASADEMRALLSRLFIMPVLTAHPTEARRRTVLDHL